MFEVLFNQLKNLEELGDLKNKKGTRTSEFFTLLTALIPIVSENKPDRLIELLKATIDHSLLHNSTERSGDYYIDSTRVGLFKIMATVLPLAKKEDDLRRRALEIVDQAKLIDHIHRDCLFYYGSNQDFDKNEDENGGEKVEMATKRCYTEASRKAAYSVLNEYQGCLEPKEMAEYLQNFVLPLVKDVERPKKWAH